jgi:hypothetical protein
MLGPPRLRWLDQPTTRSLEELVPQNHFYRFLDAKLDLMLNTWQRHSPRRGGQRVHPYTAVQPWVHNFFYSGTYGFGVETHLDIWTTKS